MKILVKKIARVGIAGLFMSAADAASRPNILFIFSDDHATQAISAYGGILADIAPTPNLDRLADDGIRFDRCMVGNSICGPSRATILTGKHSHKNGFTVNVRLVDGQPDYPSFDSTQQTFPTLLQKAGWQTAIIGKWHLGSNPTGFDYWDILPGQGFYYNPDFLNQNGVYQEQGYVTDIITDKAIQWLETGRNKEKPFVLMVQHKAAHREWSPALKYLHEFAGLIMPEPDTLFDDYKNRGTAAHVQDLSIAKTMELGKDLKIREDDVTDQLKLRIENRMTPEQFAAWNAAYQPKNDAFLKANLSGKDLVRWKYQRYIKDYLRCIKSVDDSVGRLREYLEQSGLAENTIVIYSSDQGFYLGEHGWFDKRLMYDESFRTPLLVSWPGVTPPGSVNSDLVSNLDFAETFLDIAGVEIPSDMQGESLVRIFKGQTPDDWRDSLYYHYYEYPGWHMIHRHEGAYDGRYKLINFYDLGEWELYDLQIDPHEMVNQYNNPEYAAVVQQMHEKLNDLRAQYDVPPNIKKDLSKVGRYFYSDQQRKDALARQAEQDAKE